VRRNVRKADDKRDGRNCTAERLLSYGKRYGVLESYGEKFQEGIMTPVFLPIKVQDLDSFHTASGILY
jgi:hypothetical protein